MIHPSVHYLWVTLLFLCTGISIYVCESAEIQNLREFNFSKTFIREIDTQNHKGVHILEAGSRPSSSIESEEFLQTTEPNEPEEILETQETFGNLATILLTGGKRLLKPKPTFRMPAYRPSKLNRPRPRPRPRPNYHPTPPSSSLLLLPTVTDSPPSLAKPKPTVPEIIETDIPDIGTFPTEEPSETTTGSFSFATIVPILGRRDKDIPRVRARGRFGNGRSLLSSSTKAPPVVGSVPRRRVVGTGKLGQQPSLIDIEDGKFREVKQNDIDVITDFAFSDIKCYRTRSKEYFGAVVHMKNGFHLPYIRDRPQDPMSSNECLMERTDSPNSYHMKISDLRSCGVEQCGGDQSMCLTMVFPRVPMLAMADDEVTTIKCAPQKSTMSETRSVSFTGDSSEARRSSSTVEGGGQEYVVEVAVFRQNPGAKNGLFVKRVNSGGVVQLGEPLQLRSVVRGGDGWTFSRLTDVKVWRMRDSYDHSVDRLNPNDASEVITLVDPRGCRNGDYEIISPTHPLRDPRNDLVHHFNFKAFLFRGQRANEPLIVTAKVQACQDREDCSLVDCIKDLDSDHIRYKRSERNPDTNIFNNSVIQDWSSQLALRVVGLKDHPVSISEQDFSDDENYYSSFSCTDKVVGSAILAGFLVLFLSTLVFVSATLCYQKITRIRRKSISIPTPTPTPTHSILKKLPSIQTDFIREVSKKRTDTKLRPLPPIPTSSSKKSSGKSQNTSKVSQENVGRHGDNNNSLEHSDDSEGIYVVYCCNEKNHKRSTSAPASLRGKKKTTKVKDTHTTDDTEDSDCMNENWHHRNVTRRSTKRAYRPKKLYDHAGSFPSRINKKSSPGNRSYRESKRGNHLNGFSRGQMTSQGRAFSEDSAYSGSISSNILHRNLVQLNREDRNRCSNFSSSSIKEKSANDNKSVTHFVTRNDLSTQIIIIPEISL